MSPTAKQVCRGGNRGAGGVFERRLVGCLVRGDTREQRRELWLAQGRDLADIGAGRAPLEGGGQRHDISLGLERTQLEFLDVLGVGLGLDWLAAGIGHELGQRVAVSLVVSEEYQGQLQRSRREQKSTRLNSSH